MTSIQPRAAFVGAVEAVCAPLAVATSLRKRALDVIASALALLLFAPLLLLIAIAIWLEGGGPVLFRQQRTGLGGSTFQILKFRTMSVAESGEHAKQATPGDCRVTPLGRLLRRLSIDELPQLINVLKGEMSLVGPRPHAVGHDHLWAATIVGYHDRFRAKPGLTGRAQVMGYRGVVLTAACIEQRVAADNSYIDNWTFTGDLMLILRTVPLLFGDDAAV